MFCQVSFDHWRTTIMHHLAPLSKLWSTKLSLLPTFTSEYGVLRVTLPKTTRAPCAWRTMPVRG
jgi:hypothetical protein